MKLLLTFLAFSISFLNYAQRPSAKEKGKFLEMEKTHWEDTTWKVVKENYPNAQILISNQNFKRPITRKKLMFCPKLCNIF